MLQLVYIVLSIGCGLRMLLVLLLAVAFLNRVQIEVQQAGRAAMLSTASLHPPQVDLALALGLNAAKTIVRPLSERQDRLVLADEGLQLCARLLQIDVAV